MTRLHPKHTHAEVRGLAQVRLFKVLSRAEAVLSPLLPHEVLVWDERAQVGCSGDVMLTRPKDGQVIRSGDVVRLRPDGTMVSVLYRRGSASNTLFVTERCNSLCLMCSQPPRDIDDGWLGEELLRLIPLIDKDEVQLGITGGEPTLPGTGLAGVLEACRRELPATHLHILTNGRSFASRDLAEHLVGLIGQQATWAVPVYADTPAAHDEIVGTPGAFAETMSGLAELARLGARVEIRVVLHRLSIPRLPSLASFIYRRLPFADHVALMGLEPMGLAKGNRDRLWIDPVDYLAELSAATHHLAARGMPVSLYNLPLCILPDHLRPFARRSISDWKNRFPDECAPCAFKDHCAGFFASAGPTWRSRAISPILLSETAYDMA